MFSMKLFSLKKKIKKNDFLPRIKPGAGRFCSSQGFTLVEVVVVLAIMAVIISIVMVSMSNSKKRGEDAAIQSSLREAQNAAELYSSSNNGTYDGICNDTDNTLADDGGNFQKIEEYILKHNGSGGELKCLDSASGYAIISSLNLRGCWCVDYQGTAKKVELSGAETCSEKLTGIVCP